jgi:hypothetical protein
VLYSPPKSHRQVVRPRRRRRRCTVCGQPFKSEPTTKPRRFCGDRCRDAARRQRNHEILGIARGRRGGSSGVPRISKNNRVFSKGYKADFPDRGSGITGAAVETEVIVNRSWRQVVSPDGVTCWVATSPTEPIAVTAEAAALIATIPADLSIPDFLKREASVASPTRCRKGADNAS